MFSRYLQDHFGKARAMAIVRRDFGESEEDSAGETLSFERVGSDEASLSLVSIPDSAQITIDTTTKAFAPYKTSAILQLL